MKLPRLNSFFRLLLTNIAVIVVASCVVHTGCRSLDFIVDDEFPDDGPDDGDTPQPAPDQGIVLRLANLTDAAVDTELFMTTNATSNAMAELFVEENRLIDGVGIAATGLLAPLSSDEIALPCTEELTIGTSGGRFLDQETGEVLGTGTVRILQRGLVLDCGDEISLLYHRDGETYAVDVLLE